MTELFRLAVSPGAVILRWISAWAGCFLLWVGIASASHVCPGDCDGDRRVEVSELTRGVATALGSTDVRFCPPMDVDNDGGVGVVDLVAAVRAALNGCPPHPPTATPTPTPTPVYDPQLPPVGSVDLQSWLRQGFYRDWRRVGGFGLPYHSAGDTVRGEWQYINDAMYASLVCATLEPHPAGVAAVQEMVDLEDGSPTGWLLSRKLREDSDDGRGWYWYQESDGVVLAAGSGVGECAGCHGGEELAFSIDYYAASNWPSLGSCRVIPESDGGVCTDLGLPPQAEPYVGQIEVGSGDPRPATLYLGSSIFLERWYFRQTRPDGFTKRFCGSTVPRPVSGKLTHLSADEIEFYYANPSSDRPWDVRFRGRRRDSGGEGDNR